ncbi:MAG: hypothetical protein KAI24_16165 [Planctomycetes bacterium]|nr:hypothetical protein [Planctomycetota bacterium]
MWRTRAPDDGGEEVRKVYLSGATADAEHELRMGQAAAGPGVVPYLGTCSEPTSGRPAVRLRYVAGDNLEAVVLRAGALPAAQALALVGSVATTLARLHALRGPATPRGICHGDVKPQNLLAVGDEVLLLDFEHARPIGTTTGERAFTGGTSAWSPPEAHRGAEPDAAFDVFGLGATLAFLLDGGTSRRVPRHPAVDALVLASCDVDPRRRPDAAAFAERCRRLLAVVRDDEAERHLADWSTGACKVAPSTSDDPRSAMWPRRKRLLQRLPELLRAPTSVPQDPAELQHELELVARVLARFPRSAAALTRRRQLLAGVAALLAGAAETVHARLKAERFDDALDWLRTTESLVSAATAIPAGLASIVALPPGEAPGALHRAPFEFVQLLTDKAEGARRELAERADEISAAERALDLVRTERLIDAMANDYGGTSPTVAERRDQLHRLGFYLDRIARSQPNVERVGPLWDPVALQPLQALVAAAGAALEARAQRDAGGGAVGLRSLQLTLANVCEEFPHLEQAPPALDALAQALLHLTDQAWQQLADAEQRLTIVPVPVRPLQLALGRLDTFRMLEAFVDRPDRPRSELLDGLERLRLGLEQARSARDRLAENAEHALARGHWTTGLFEMERAVAGLNHGDDSERVEAERLQERLQAARRTKREIETAVRRNVELSAAYTALEDDAMSTFGARLQVLQERRDCLMFLGMHVQTERAELYRKDLRKVETQIALERAGDAERRLNGLTDPVQRLRLARETLESLGIDDSGDGSNEQSGRMLRLQEHWRTVTAQCQRAVAAMHHEQQLRRRQRRRLLLVTVLLALATTTAIGFALKPLLFGQPAMASGK